jgi:uncharacterized oligopeptide transporter (OPT) family protein
MIVDYKLTYPSGTATAYLINGFHTPEGAKLAKYIYTVLLLATFSLRKNSSQQLVHVEQSTYNDNDTFQEASKDTGQVLHVQLFLGLFSVVLHSRG